MPLFSRRVVSGAVRCDSGAVRATGGAVTPPGAGAPAHAITLPVPPTTAPDARGTNTEIRRHSTDTIDLNLPASPYRQPPHALLAADDLVFQADIVHFLTERGATRDYARRVGSFTIANLGEFNRAHAAGIQAELKVIQDFFGDPTDPTYGIIGVPALGEVGTAHPLLRVAPGDSARSVLLRKLIGGDAHDKLGDDYPAMGVDGRRMPLDAAPLIPDSILLIQAWIDGGAIVN